MRYYTHVAGGIMAGMLVSAHIPPADFLNVAVSAACALLPDVDTTDSFAGRRIKPVSFVAGLTGHRKIFHSLWPVFLILLFLPGPLKYYAAAGYFSHLLLDAMTPGSVPWLWPLPYRWGLRLIPTGSMIEKLIVLPVLVIGIAKLIIPAGIPFVH